MSLKALRPRSTRYAGIDCSTNSIAYAVIEDNKLVAHGEEFFTGSDVFERMLDAKRKVNKLVESGILKVDIVFFEKAVIVRSAAVAMKMAYVFGACMSELMAGGAEIKEIAPLTWQSSIGNPSLKPVEKAKLKKDFPGRSASWYSNRGREIRKQRTLSIVNQYFKLSETSDNIGDSLGLVLFGHSKLGK